MKWVAVLHDNSFKSFKSLTVILDVHFGFNKLTQEKRIPLHYMMYDYLTYDINIVEYHPIILGWKIISFSDPRVKHAYNNFVIAEIMDPKGVVKNHFTPNYKGISGVIEAIENLKNLSLFDNWFSYDLYKENESLKYQLKEQEEQFLKLELQVKSFKETASFKSLNKKISKYIRTGDKQSIKKLIKENKLNKNFINSWFSDE